MDCKLWRMLYNFYRTFKCCVKIGGSYSDWFNCLQGVHQGEPWSMYLYMKMINELLSDLREMDYGAKIGLIHTGNPAFADDVAIITIHKPLLQKMLEYCHGYATKRRFKYNLKKTEILVFGKDSCPNTQLFIGSKEIVVKDGSYHMGIPVTDSGIVMSRLIEERIDKGQKAYFAVQGLGNKRLPVTPVVASKIYWSVCVPKIMHGLEICKVKDSDLGKLEQSHGKIAKQIQGLPKQTPNSACIVPLGWLSLEAYIDKMKLLFLWRLLLLSMNCVYKNVAVHRVIECINFGHCDDSPIGNMVSTFRKYKMIDILILGVSSGVYMSISEFKNTVRTRIYEYENERFKISMNMVCNRSLYSNCLESIRLWSWWKVAFKLPENVNNVRILLRLMFGLSRLRNDLFTVVDTDDRKCQICNMNEDQSIQHVLFRCSNNIVVDTRKEWYNQLENVIPEGMKASFFDMSDDDRTVFILSGFNSEYIPEFIDIYIVFMEYVCKLYNLSMILVDEL